MNVGYLASKAAVGILNAAPPLTTITHFYAEMEDPNNSDDTQNNVRVRPCVTCFFESSHENPPFTGNYNGTLVVKVELWADDHTAAQAEQIFEDVFSRFSTDTIIADLSAAQANFTAFGFWDGIQQSAETIEGDGAKRLRCKSMMLPINCCPSDIS